MEDVKRNKGMGWEIARQVEEEKPSIMERAMLSREQIRTLLIYSGAFILLFIGAVWLAGNPFEFTQRIPSGFVKAKGWIGTDNWMIVWWVVLCCAFFEYMDSAGGMGYGTALTPLMLMAGFDPKQVVPCVMITEMFTGLIAGLIHGEFENVEWKFSPMNETTKLTLIVAIIGLLCVCFSITAAYKVLKVHKFWIKLYVAGLLVVMGACSLLTAKKYVNYKPKWMWLFAGVAGFNKGIGGGGYGPVVTVGGLIAGVPVKSMLAVTAISEGTVSTFAILVWLGLLTSGVTIDYLLLPSLMLATIFSAVAAPYMIRVFPEKMWRIVVPGYCCVVAALCFWKIIPDVISKLS